MDDVARGKPKGADEIEKSMGPKERTSGDILQERSPLHSIDSAIEAKIWKSHCE